jgi:hypothetical protein
VTKARQVNAMRHVFSGCDEALADRSYLLAAPLAPVPPNPRGAAQFFISVVDTVQRGGGFPTARAGPGLPGCERTSFGH